LIGRQEELDVLDEHLQNAMEGKGSSVFISGKPGIGKTHLVNNFLDHAGASNVKIISGEADANTINPFLIFSNALEKYIDEPLFQKQRYTSFTEIFAVNRSGLLVAKAAPEGEDSLDSDIVASMLSAILNFVRESLKGTGEKRAGVGRLEYGDMKILIEHGEHIFLTGVFQGAEHPEMKNALRKSVREIEIEHGEMLKEWRGNIKKTIEVQKLISSLSDEKFLVRQDLEGKKLENERFRVSDIILEHLINISKSQALVLVLEDLQWADDSSKYVLNYLARNISKENILLLGTFRPLGCAAIIKSVKEMEEDNFAQSMPLGKLSRDNIISIVNKINPQNNFSNSFLENLASRCEGNPFFLIEIIKQMRDEGCIVKENGGYSITSEEFTIPDNVEEIVHRRLEMVDPSALTLAEYASCIGKTFDRDVALSMKTLRDPNSALETLEKSGVLTLNNGTISFDNAIYQEIIYSSIRKNWLGSYHRSLGEYYEEEFRGRLHEVLYELARHFSNSREDKKAFDYCYRAAEKAESAYAPEEAARFYEKALALISSTSEKDKEALILERLGDNQRFIGEYDMAIKNFSKVADIGKDNETKARMYRKTSFILQKMGNYDESMENVLAGEKLAYNNKAELCRLLNQKAFTFMRLGKYDDGIELCKQALEGFEGLPNVEKDIGGSYNTIGACYRFKGDYEPALEHYMKSLELADETGHIYTMASALNNIGIIYHDRGDLEKALDFYNRCLEIDKNIGNQYGLASTYNNTGLILQDQGKLDNAMKYQRMGLKIRERIGDKDGIATSHINIGMLMHFMNNFQEAAAGFQKGIDIYRTLGSKDGVVDGLLGLAETYIADGQLKEAEPILAEAESTAEEIGMREQQAMGMKIRGLLMAANKDWKESEKWFNKSIEEYDSLELEIEVAITLFYYGCMLLTIEENIRGKKALETALGNFERFGADLWRDKCRDRLEKINYSNP